jgi:hypothetical protein
MKFGIKAVLLTIIVISLLQVVKLTKKTRSCNKLVTLVGENTLKCKWINHYNSGFSSVQLCDGTDLVIKTDDIIKIENLKKP